MNLKIDPYLARLGIEQSNPSLAYLNQLIRAHRKRVAIENLRAFYNNPLPFDKETLFKQIILTKRGGYQLQLNALFEDLLKTLGFQTQLVSAIPWLNDEKWGKDMDLMMILISMDKKKYLVDVGLPIGPFSALEVSESQVRLDITRYFKFEVTPDNEYVLYRSSDFSHWIPLFKSNLLTKRFIEFIERDKTFTERRIFPFLPGKYCCRSLDHGKIILTERELILEENAISQRYPIRLEEEFLSMLDQHFGINPKGN